MDKKEKKKFDVQVMRLLSEHGILNMLNATMVTDIADEVNKSPYDALKPYKDLKDDIDNQIAMEIVLQFLKNKKMEETLRCISVETNKKMIPKPSSGIVKRELGIAESDDAIYDIFQDYTEKIQSGNNVFDHIHNQLIENIKERIKNSQSTKSKDRSHHSHSKSRSGSRRHRKHSHSGKSSPK